MNNLNIPTNPEQREITLAWFGGSLAIAIVVRLALWLTYSPIPYSDTPSYRRLAESVLQGFARYDGTRTPGYPAFLALIGPDLRVWAVQMGMGVLICMALFYLGWRLTGKGWFGALLALVHTANLGQLFFEANLLTETPTTFYLAVSFVAIYILLQQVRRSRWLLSATTGLAVSLAVLTRPLFVYLPVWMFLFITFAYLDSGDNSWRLTWKTRMIRLASYSLPVIVLVGGWVLFIHERFEDWSLTTMTGYHLVQHTGGYFEYVPDEYAVLRDIYIQYRDAKIVATGTQTNAIWEAIPEMSRVSGLSFYELSRTLTHISINLIREHPDLFLKNVVEGWWMFWRAPIYWSPVILRVPSGLVKSIDVLIMVERALLVLFNAIFVVGSLIWLLVCYLPRRWMNRLPSVFHHLRDTFLSGGDSRGNVRADHLFMLFLVGNIWITSILQSLLDHGDNPRFLLPLQSFVVLWAVWFILQIKHSWIRKK